MNGVRIAPTCAAALQLPKPMARVEVGYTCHTNTKENYQIKLCTGNEYHDEK